MFFKVIKSHLLKVICHFLKRVQSLQVAHDCDKENSQCAGNQCKVGLRTCKSFRFRHRKVSITCIDWCGYLKKICLAICWKKAVCYMRVSILSGYPQSGVPPYIVLNYTHIVINCSQFLCFGFLLFVLCQISIFFGKCVLNIFVNFCHKRKKKRCYQE